MRHILTSISHFYTHQHYHQASRLEAHAIIPLHSRGCIFPSDFAYYMFMANALLLFLQLNRSALILTQRNLMRSSVAVYQVCFERRYYEVFHWCVGSQNKDVGVTFLEILGQSCSHPYLQWLEWNVPFCSTNGFVKEAIRYCALSSIDVCIRDIA